MKVVMVNDYFGRTAGAFAVAWDLSGELIGRGHQVEFVCADEGAERPTEEVVDGRPVFRLPVKTPMRLQPLLTIHRPGLVKQAADLIASRRPDVVHAHVVHLHLSFGLLRELSRRGLPVVLSAHDVGIFCPIKFICQPPDDPARTVPWTDCLRCRRLRYLPGKARLQVGLVNRHVKAVAAVSRSLADILAANGVRRPQVVHNGLDVTALAERGLSGAAFRQRHNLGEGPLILFGGRLSQFKGDEAAVRALAVLPEVMGARLVVAGWQDQVRPGLKRLIDQLGLADRIVITGWLDREAMLGAYRAASVVLFPSIYPDPFGLIHLEAMALARPVVGTKFGGTAEVVVDGETGFLVDPRDSAQTAARLGRLLADPDLADRMGQAGQKRAKAHFSLGKQADEFERIYRQVL